MNRDPRTKADLIETIEREQRSRQDAHLQLDRLLHEISHILECEKDRDVVLEEARSLKSSLDADKRQQNQQIQDLALENAKLWHMIRVLSKDPDVAPNENDDEENVFDRTDPSKQRISGGLQPVRDSMRGI